MNRLHRSMIAIAMAGPAAAPAEAMPVGSTVPIPPPAVITPVLSSENDHAGLSALAGSETELTGYLLPVDREGELVYQFALVPYPGACSHMPQPPASAVVLVTPDKPYKLDQVYEYVTVRGRLKLRPELSQLFILDGVVMLKSDYVIAGADVREAAGGITAPPPGASPWKFLKK